MARKRYLNLRTDTLIVNGTITPSGMITDPEKDQTGMDPDYFPPMALLGLDYHEQALVRIWKHPAGYTWMEKYLLLEGMKMLSYLHRKEALEFLQRIALQHHINEET